MGRPAMKKRKLNQSATEEVLFDPSARQEYLTGFHKRKVQRTKAAQEAAAQKARQERIEDRKMRREERKAELERHVKEVNAMLPGRSLASEAEDGDENGEEAVAWDGIEEAAPEPVDHEAEYIDEDKYTTVTVEEVDISRDGISRLRDGDDEEGENEKKAADSPKHIKTSSAKKPLGKKDKDKRPKKKKKTFRYESPAERKMGRLKVKAKNSKAARIRRGD
ncbi:hypothetical protein LTR70_001392 [Exophiala xenobiotica]|uniref:Nucleolar protein 12 n=1 Tax=Lithohypha guttulata TaxID=1690604 RepID=A0ABR0KMB5_9EURO|nr:hypothetical protein LTR24_000853 [Lithohypha guttulata]KAK5328071.1 hypothetical protein LTR70_001392 [Exophiala xenobiotica]